MGVDPLDIVAIILGVFFTIRKLDAQGRTHKEFSHVAAEDFERWQQTEVSVFGTAMVATFAKVILDWTFVYFFAQSVPFSLARSIGASIDISWFIVMIVTIVRVLSLGKMRTKLGIVLGGFVVDGGTELSTEMKSALRDLEDGDVDKALYKLKQVTLDPDETMKGIALYWMGECHLRQGDRDAARTAFEQSVEADPRLVQPKDALEKLGAVGDSSN